MKTFIFKRFITLGLNLISFFWLLMMTFCYDKKFTEFDWKLFFFMGIVYVVTEIEYIFKYKKI